MGKFPQISKKTKIRKFTMISLKRRIKKSLLRLKMANRCENQMTESEINPEASIATVVVMMKRIRIKTGVVNEKVVAASIQLPKSEIKTKSTDAIDTQMFGTK